MYDLQNILGDYIEGGLLKMHEETTYIVWGNGRDFEVTIYVKLKE